MPHVKQLAVLAFMDNGECHQAMLTTGTRMLSQDNSRH